MKRIAAIAVIGLLLLAGTTWSSEVTNVEISYQDGSVVARIDVTGSVRYTHQTEVPKNGRPDRVIVDILSATHELGAKEFLETPPCIITGIRTSQFAVTPEKIVRVVFDLGGAPLYQVDSDSKSISIKFEDRTARTFAAWSTASLVKAQLPKAPTPAKKEVAQAPPAPAKSQVTKQNEAIEKDRQTSLAAKSSPATALKPPPAKAEPEKKPHRTSDRRFGAATYSDPTSRPTKPEPTKPSESQPALPTLAAVENDLSVPTPKPTEATERKKKAASVDKPKVTKDTPAKPPVAKETPKKTAPPAPSPVPKKKAASDMAAAPAKVKSESAVVKPAPKKSAPAQGQKALAKKVGVTPSGSQAPKKTQVAQTGTKDKPADATKQRATARFRRKMPSAKIRGTMVAEFPKRLVIKYKTGGRRDPFGSLIDQTRTYNDPIEPRIPNVEGLKLVGVIDSDGDSNRALFEDKAGFSYMLKSGDKVRNGYVLRVETDRVYFQIFEYGWSRTVALEME
jgi:hypothetical protein